MQPEWPTALNVFDTDYHLEYSKDYSGTVHQETTKRGISALYFFAKSLSVAHIWKLHQFHFNSKVYCCCNLL